MQAVRAAGVGVTGLAADAQCTVCHVLRAAHADRDLGSGPHPAIASDLGGVTRLAYVVFHIRSPPERMPPDDACEVRGPTLALSKW